jgi:transcriptional regulator with XRE-family HTH domain
MRSKIGKKIAENMSLETKRFVRIYGDIVVKVNGLLEEKGMTQKELAEKMDKKPSEINKWLKGEHNFTLRSIAKLEAELGETILEVPNPLGNQKPARKRGENKMFTVHRNMSFTGEGFKKAETFKADSPAEERLIPSVA